MYRQSSLTRPSYPIKVSQLGRSRKTTDHLLGVCAEEAQDVVRGWRVAELCDLAVGPRRAAAADEQVAEPRSSHRSALPECGRDHRALGRV